MKHSKKLLIIFAVIIISLFLFKIKENPFIRKDAVEIKMQSDSNEILRSDSSVSPETTNLPFGCELLVHHKFPARWEDNYWEVKGPHVKEIYEVISCYNNLNTVKSIPPPIVNRIEYVPVQEYDRELYKDLPIRLAIDSCKYKLPDFGMYECYYTYNYSRQAREMGYLVLYNPRSGTAKILGIYNLIPASEISAGYRFFYINSDRTIQIFALDVNENEMHLKQTHSIEIFEDGQINIKAND